MSSPCARQVGGLSQGQLRRDVLLFGTADVDGDGLLALPEFRRHLLGCLAWALGAD